MFTITDTENYPVDIFEFKGVRVNCKYYPNTGVCEIFEINSDHTQQDIEDNYDTWKAEYKTAEENKVDVKANAKAKLIAGEPLTEEEADTIVL
tara:strand:+ start:691 stop:969 length:279 start_codon:yes stop_codon:yes gene_type:complete